MADQHLETIRDLLMPGLPALESQPLVPDDWKWRPTLSLEIEGDSIVLRVSEIDEPFPIVMPDEIADGLYKSRVTARLRGAWSQAKMVFAGRKEPEAG